MFPLYPSDAIRLALFVAAGATISWMSHLLRRAVRQVSIGAQQLATGEALFRNTFDQAAVGIAHVGLDGRWLRLNARLAEIVGYAPEELQARTFQDITHPGDLDADLAHVQALLRGESERYAMDKRYVRRDGSLVWVRLTVSLVRAPAGAPDYFIAVVEDVDAGKRARAEAGRLGAMRGRLGWSEAELVREFAILREEIEAAVRRRVAALGDAGVGGPVPAASVDEALALLAGFAEHAERASVVGFRRAATTGGTVGPAPGS